MGSDVDSSASNKCSIPKSCGISTKKLQTSKSIKMHLDFITKDHRKIKIVNILHYLSLVDTHICFSCHSWHVRYSSLVNSNFLLIQFAENVDSFSFIGEIICVFSWKNDLGLVCHHIKLMGAFNNLAAIHIVSYFHHKNKNNKKKNPNKMQRLMNVAALVEARKMSCKFVSILISVRVYFTFHLCQRNCWRTVLAWR